MPIWSSAWRKISGKGPEFNIRLPTELWAIIIDLIVVPLRHPYLYCEPETFPQYDELLMNVDTSDKIPFLEDWKRVRAVCNEWMHLAGVNPCFFFKGGPGASPPFPTVHQSTSTVFIYSKANTRLAMERIAHLKENLTTLALGLNPWNTNPVDILLENPSIFPNLRCLSIYSSRSKRPFWQVIQDEFPDLISLTIHHDTYEQPGRYVLKSLEILSISRIDRVQLVCPSLKHLRLRSTTNPAAELEFIKEHGHQLQSFIGSLWTLLNVRKEEDIWSLIFPNLVMSGCSMRYERRAVPPPGHPLRHLRFFAGHDKWTPDNVMVELDAYGSPGIESVHINMTEMRHGTADDLRAQCRKRGIRLVEIVDGKPVVVPPPKPTMESIREGIILCTLPCTLPCLLLCYDSD
ncbi:hypothetical protein FRC18_009920 [Serendipita sp. 400]|nr:hypothetical protein FRC18_009920 [Serendipita sp. 400]